jgi:hypothetical protein
MKKLTAILAAFSLALFPISPANAADAYNAEDISRTEGKAIYLINEESSENPFPGIRSTTGQPGPTRSGRVCSSAADTSCFYGNGVTKATAIIPVCESANSKDCVVSLELAGTDGVFHSAKFVRKVIGEEFPAVPEANFPGATSTSLWEVPQVLSASGTSTYSVTVTESLDYKYSTGKWSVVAVDAKVVPYREATGSYIQPKQITEKNQWGNDYPGATGFAHECAWQEVGKCGRPQDFAPETQVRLSIRVSDKVGGWFRGRLKAPQISVSSFSSETNLLTIEAAPVGVSRTQIVRDIKDLSAVEKKYMAANGFTDKTTSVKNWSSASNSDAFNVIEAFRAGQRDTASGINTYWGFGTIPNVKGNKCLTDKTRVLGIVTTNAMAYDGGAPAFTGGFLNYKVGGLHYLPGGKDLSLGSYDLVMRSDTARCLYGFSNAPLSATVTVVNDRGSKVTATSVVSEKNGWLKMAAYGFTFSNKTIKVKITKKAFKPKAKPAPKKR